MPHRQTCIYVPLMRGKKRQTGDPLSFMYNPFQPRTWYCGKVGDVNSIAIVDRSDFSLNDSFVHTYIHSKSQPHSRYVALK